MRQLVYVRYVMEAKQEDELVSALLPTLWGTCFVSSPAADQRSKSHTDKL